MKNLRAKAEAFLAEEGVSVDAIDAERILAAFDREMTDGLSARGSSLSMIPTYLSVERPVPVGQPAIVIDAGGTNLRVAVVSFTPDGQARIEHFERHPMPGTGGAVDAEGFFAQLARHVAPLAGAAGEIGFCFSYPAEISPDCDGRLLTWTKEIQAPEVVGRFVGAGLAEHLARRGLRKRITLLNDTVAALLAGKSLGAARRYGGYVGFILGTGTNTAYVERNRNIAKCPGLDPAGAQAINVESGNFAACPRSRLDAEFDAGTANPGRYTFEKMISGAYMGGLCLHAVRTAAARGLFQPATARAIEALERLSTKEADDFAGRPFGEGPLAAAAIPDDDRETIVHCFRAVIRRAARLAAINIAAAVIRSQAGRSPLFPVCVNAEGSTFYRTRGFPSLVDQHLRAMLEPREVYFEIVHVEEAPLIGAAVAALTRG